MNLAFFGAFNPPTRAHLELAQFAMKKTGAEKVVFVPSKETYISGEQGFFQRLELLGPNDGDDSFHGCSFLNALLIETQIGGVGAFAVRGDVQAACFVFFAHAQRSLEDGLHDKTDNETADNDERQRYQDAKELAYEK